MGAWSGLKQSQPADGLFYRPVCAIAPTPTRIDVFGDRGGSTLFHQWWDGTQSNSEDLGGSIFSPVCATSWVQSPRLGGPKPYRIDVFALDVHSALIHNSQQQGQAWTGWNSLGGVYTSPPSAVSWGPGRIDVFMLGQNHDLRWLKFDDNQWSAEQSLGGVYTSPPSAVSWGANRIDVFMLGTDHGLRQLTFGADPGPKAHWQWQAEQNHHGLYTSPPSAVSWGANRIDVFMLGQNHDLRWLKFDGNWNPELPLGGIYTSPPSAVSWGPGELDVFMLGQNHALFHNGNFGNSEGNFNGEDSRGGQNLISQPAAVSSAPGRLDVFVIGPNTPIDDCNLWHDSWI